MQRVSADGATVDNQFTDGNPSAGIEATIVPAVWLNSVQEEVAHVIEGTGGTLDPNNNHQLLPAIQSIAGSVRVDGSDTTPGNLTSKLLVSGAISKSIQNPSGNETLTLTIASASTSTEGTSKLATTTQAQAGSSTSVAVTPAAMAGALGVSQWVQGSTITPTGGTTVTFTHSLGRTPRLVQLTLQCVSAEGNYSAGDQVMYGSFMAPNGAATNGMAVVIPSGNTSSIDIKIGAQLSVPDKTSLAAVAITPAKWSLIPAVWG